MGATKEQAEQTREALLRAALKLFHEKGFAATRLQDIAETAGVTRGAVYWHFKNKLDIFEALFDETMQALMEVIDGILASGLEPVEKIRKVCITIGEKIFEDDRFRAFSFLYYGIEWTKEVHQIVSSKIRGRKEEEERPLLNLIRAGQENGTFRNGVKAETVLKVLKIFFHGMVDNIVDQHEDIKKEELPGIVDCFLNGMKA